MRCGSARAPSRIGCSARVRSARQVAVVLIDFSQRPRFGRICSVAARCWAAHPRRHGGTLASMFRWAAGLVQQATDGDLAGCRRVGHPEPRQVARTGPAQLRDRWRREGLGVRSDNNGVCGVNACPGSSARPKPCRWTGWPFWAVLRTGPREMDGFQLGPGHGWRLRRSGAQAVHRWRETGTAACRTSSARRLSGRADAWGLLSVTAAWGYAVSGVRAGDGSPAGVKGHRAADALSFLRTPSSGGMMQHESDRAAFTKTVW